MWELHGAYVTCWASVYLGGVHLSTQVGVTWDAEIRMSRGVWAGWDGVSPSGLLRPSPAGCFLLSLHPRPPAQKTAPCPPTESTGPKKFENHPATHSCSQQFPESELSVSLLPPQALHLFEPTACPVVFPAVQSPQWPAGPPRPPPGTPTCVMCVRGGPWRCAVFGHHESG